MELHNKLKGKIGEQEITIIGSKVFKVINLFGLFLHIAAFVLGFFTLFEIAFDGMEEGKHILEIVTLVVVGLLIIEHALEPIAERVLLWRALYDFWGDKEVETVLSKAENIDMKAGGFGKITQQKNFRQKENISIKWIKTSRFSSKKLAITMETPAIKKWKNIANEEGNVVAYLVPRYIIIDMTYNKVRLGGKLLFELVEDEVRREMEFTFDVPNQKATWSGVFPEHPFYGAWKWSENDSTFEHTKEHHVNFVDRILGKK